MIRSRTTIAPPFWSFTLTIGESNSESESDGVAAPTAPGMFVAPGDADQISGTINHTAFLKPNLAHDLGRVPILDSPGGIKGEFHNTDAYHNQSVIDSSERPGLKRQLPGDAKRST